MTFDEWYKEQAGKIIASGVSSSVDAYNYRINFKNVARMGWNAAVNVMVEQENKVKDPCPLCEMMMRPDHDFNYCFRCGKKLK